MYLKNLDQNHHKNLSDTVPSGRIRTGVHNRVNPITQEEIEEA